MEKQKIRIAQISGYVVKKRCRKEQFELVDGIGLTTEEAIENLKNNFSQEKGNWKQARFPLQAIVYDGARMIYDTYSSIQRPLIPNASDNVESFEFVA